MRLATWNVNSIRTRIDRVTAFLEREDIDVLAMQEIKCKPEQFPRAALEEAGYELSVHGLNQWNGVAIASRVGLEDVATSFLGQPAWASSPEADAVVEARALGATVGTTGPGAPVRLWSLYVPNGRELQHPHYTYKLAWLEALRQATDQWLAAQPDLPLALVGDWNVAPLDTDVWDMAAFAGATHVSAPEREAFAAFTQIGLREVTRELVDGYTYWDYQKLRFPRNEGMRIDFVQASPALAARVSAAAIDRFERKGKGASDHAPVIVTID
ncbi:Exodeoxyribonuclease III [Actinomyces bovis]|uniref:Exodeoxyribonuclease III n=1 Tax=Actinomyces bovis TaxID=1658 RepID=A0ABY1VNM8_9ACTO|nr:exodeoxyribonuclease III [Actinomyces bovis]SPT53570.1 Exodeoxyribonuclease III [Actinomyces bovis]VEG55562.1 Exodeoxyribonuclease III [Actinomyces israelii]